MIEGKFLPIVEIDENVKLEPYGEEIVREFWQDLDKEAAVLAEQEAQRRKDEEEARRLKIEQEEEEANLKKGLSPNFVFDGHRARFDFTTGKMSHEVSRHGYVEYRLLLSGTNCLFVDSGAFLALSVKYFPVFMELGMLPSYTVAIDVNLQSYPQSRLSLFRTAKPSNDREAVEISVQSDGALGVGDLCDGSLGRIVPRQWSFVCVCVDTLTSNVCIYLNGEMVGNISGLPELVTGGPACLGEDGLCLFASEDRSAMCGGEVRSCAIFSSALNPSDVMSLYSAHTMENSWSCERCMANNSNDVIQCKLCGTPKAVLSDKQKAAIANQNPLMDILRAIAPPGFDFTESDLQAAIDHVGSDDPDQLVAYFMRVMEGEEEGFDINAIRNRLSANSPMDLN